MNPLHYPSLELCNKLTEIGFPETEKQMKMDIQVEDCGYELQVFVCPSVMEMLDVMPNRIQFSYFLRISKLITGQIKVEYRKTEGIDIVYGASDIESLSNALAETILWLHDNNYISFTK